MDGPWEEAISVFQDLFAALKMIGTGSIFKILLTFSQIVSSMFENLFVPWPSFVSYGIQIYSWFDLDLLTATSVMCSFPRQNHYSKLLNATLLPVGAFSDNSILQERLTDRQKDAMILDELLQLCNKCKPRTNKQSSQRTFFRELSFNVILLGCCANTIFLSWELPMLAVTQRHFPQDTRALILRSKPRARAKTVLW